jgi:hypothetical protein
LYPLNQEVKTADTRGGLTRKVVMNEFQATAVMVALFALRCVVPIILMAVIGYAMNRLVDHWEAEEAAQGETKPAVQVAMATKAAPKLPCWVFNNCDETARAGCPAFKNQSVACWVARMRADGQLPAKCAGCELYNGVPAGTRIGFSGD